MGDLGELVNPSTSPLTGGYLLVVLAEPRSEQHKEALLKRLAKGLLSWDVQETGIDIESELHNITVQCPQAEDVRNGEKLIQIASDSLVTEILIHPQVNTFKQCLRNLMASFTRHRHIVHAGYTLSGTGSWILQDGLFEAADFLEVLQDGEVQRLLRAYEPGTITMDIHCEPEADWTLEVLNQNPAAKSMKMSVNPTDRLEQSSSGLSAFIQYISDILPAISLEKLLEPSDVVGNIRFSHPTLYVFPGGQGDSALFGISGFNILVDGGFGRKPCFWDFTRHLDRLDAVVMTRFNASSLSGLTGAIDRKATSPVYPQIGHMFCNIPQGESDSPSPDGDKDSADPLLVHLFDVGLSMSTSLNRLQLKAQPIYRNREIEPVNLYHKVGHGTLDMYVISPSLHSGEVKDFLRMWKSGEARGLGAAKRTVKMGGRDFQIPLLDLISVCALLVWQPADPAEPVTRILFPGSAPQQKILDGLEKIRHLEFMKAPVFTAKSLVAQTPIIMPSSTTAAPIKAKTKSNIAAQTSNNSSTEKIPDRKAMQSSRPTGPADVAEVRQLVKSVTSATSKFKTDNKDKSTKSASDLKKSEKTKSGDNKDGLEKETDSIKGTSARKAKTDVADAKEAEKSRPKSSEVKSRVESHSAASRTDSGEIRRPKADPKPKVAKDVPSLKKEPSASSSSSMVNGTKGAPPLKMKKEVANMRVAEAKVNRTAAPASTTSAIKKTTDAEGKEPAKKRVVAKPKEEASVKETKKSVEKPKSPKEETKELRPKVKSEKTEIKTKETDKPKVVKQTKPKPVEVKPKTVTASAEVKVDTKEKSTKPVKTESKVIKKDAPKPKEAPKSAPSKPKVTEKKTKSGESAKPSAGHSQPVPIKSVKRPPKPVEVSSAVAASVVVGAVASAVAVGALSSNQEVIEEPIVATEAAPAAAAAPPPAAAAAEEASEEPTSQANLDAIESQILDGLVLDTEEKAESEEAKEDAEDGEKDAASATEAVADVLSADEENKAEGDEVAADQEVPAEEELNEEASGEEEAAAEETVEVEEAAADEEAVVEEEAAAEEAAADEEVVAEEEAAAEEDEAATEEEAVAEEEVVADEVAEEEAAVEEEAVADEEAAEDEEAVAEEEAAAEEVVADEEAAEDEEAAAEEEDAEEEAVAEEQAVADEEAVAAEDAEEEAVAEEFTEEKASAEVESAQEEAIAEDEAAAEDDVVDRETTSAGTKLDEDTHTGTDTGAEEQETVEDNIIDDKQAVENGVEKTDEHEENDDKEHVVEHDEERHEDTTQKDTLDTHEPQLDDEIEETTSDRISKEDIDVDGELEVEEHVEKSTAGTDSACPPSAADTEVEESVEAEVDVKETEITESQLLSTEAAISSSTTAPQESEINDNKEIESVEDSASIETPQVSEEVHAVTAAEVETEKSLDTEIPKIDESSAHEVISSEIDAAKDDILDENQDSNTEQLATGNTASVDAVSNQVDFQVEGSIPSQIHDDKVNTQDAHEEEEIESHAEKDVEKSEIEVSSEKEDDDQRVTRSEIENTSQELTEKVDEEVQLVAAPDLTGKTDQHSVDEESAVETEDNENAELVKCDIVAQQSHENEQTQYEGESIKLNSDVSSDQIKTDVTGTQTSQDVERSELTEKDENFASEEPTCVKLSEESYQVEVSDRKVAEAVTDTDNSTLADQTITESRQDDVPKPSAGDDDFQKLVKEKDEIDADKDFDETEMVAEESPKVEADVALSYEDEPTEREDTRAEQFEHVDEDVQDADEDAAKEPEAELASIKEVHLSPVSTSERQVESLEVDDKVQPPADLSLGSSDEVNEEFVAEIVTKPVVITDPIIDQVPTHSPTKPEPSITKADKTTPVREATPQIEDDDTEEVQEEFYQEIRTKNVESEAKQENVETSPINEPISSTSDEKLKEIEAAVEITGRKLLEDIISHSELQSTSFLQAQEDSPVEPTNDSIDQIDTTPTSNLPADGALGQSETLNQAEETSTSQQEDVQVHSPRKTEGEDLAISNLADEVNFSQSPELEAAERDSIPASPKTPQASQCFDDQVPASEPKETTTTVIVETHYEEAEASSPMTTSVADAHHTKEKQDNDESYEEFDHKVQNQTELSLTVTDTVSGISSTPVSPRSATPKSPLSPRHHVAPVAIEEPVTQVTTSQLEAVPISPVTTGPSDATFSNETETTEACADDEKPQKQSDDSASAPLATPKAAESSQTDLTEAKDRKPSLTSSQAADNAENRPETSQAANERPETQEEPCHSSVVTENTVQHEQIPLSSVEEHKSDAFEPTQTSADDKQDGSTTNQNAPLSSPSTCSSDIKSDEDTKGLLTSHSENAAYHDDHETVETNSPETFATSAKIEPSFSQLPVTQVEVPITESNTVEVASTTAPVTVPPSVEIEKVEDAELGEESSHVAQSPSGDQINEDEDANEELKVAELLMTSATPKSLSPRTSVSEMKASDQDAKQTKPEESVPTEGQRPSSEPTQTIQVVAILEQALTRITTSSTDVPVESDHVIDNSTQVKDVSSSSAIEREGNEEATQNTDEDCEAEPHGVSGSTLPDVLTQQTNADTQLVSPPTSSTTAYFDGYLLQYEGGQQANTRLSTIASSGEADPESSIDSNISSKTYDKPSEPWKTDDKHEADMGASAFSSGPSSWDAYEKEASTVMAADLSHRHFDDQSATSSIASHTTDDYTAPANLDHPSIVSQDLEAAPETLAERRDVKQIESLLQVSDPLTAHDTPSPVPSSPFSAEAKDSMSSLQTDSSDYCHLSESKVDDSASSMQSEYSDRISMSDRVTTTPFSDASNSSSFREDRTVLESPITKSEIGLKESSKAAFDSGLDISTPAEFTTILPTSVGGIAMIGHSDYESATIDPKQQTTDNQWSTKNEPLHESTKVTVEERYSEAERDWERQQYYPTSTESEPLRLCGQDAATLSDYYGQQHSYYDEHQPETSVEVGDEHPYEIYESDVDDRGSYGYPDQTYAASGKYTEASDYLEQEDFHHEEHEGDHQNGNSYHYYHDDMTTQSIEAAQSNVDPNRNDPLVSKDTSDSLAQATESTASRQDTPSHVDDRTRQQQQQQQQSSVKHDETLASWGKPLGLPTPVAPVSVNGIDNKKSSNAPSNSPLKRSKVAPSATANGSTSAAAPFYVDLAYIPHHGDPKYCDVEFFKRVRARHYVLSTLEPSVQVLEALLEGKQSWAGDDKELDVTIIPTYDSDTLGQWVSANEETLARNRIDLAPSASRCTINLQDHETSCSAYRLEF